MAIGIKNTADTPAAIIPFIVNELYLCVLHPNLIEYTADTKSQNANTKCVYYNITFINFWHIFFISFTSFRTIPMEYKNKKIEIIYPK